VFDLEFERRLTAALRHEVPSDAGAKAHLMERVRQASHELPRQGGWFLRGSRHSVIGLALAAGIGSITTLSALMPPRGVMEADARTGVIGDTVVSTLRDTLRLVRLIFEDSAARQVAVVGDFNGWRLADTPLARDAASHRWSATLALRDGAHRYAFVVDGTRWVPDPTAERVRADDGRVYSLLHVARVTN
jgi:hypothetical protein